MKIRRVLHLYEGRVTPFPDPYAAGIPTNLSFLGYDVRALDVKQLTVDDYSLAFRRFAPDVVLCFLRNGTGWVKAGELHKQYRTSVPLINWYAEDPNALVHDNTLALSHLFDFWFTINPKTPSLYKTKAYYLPLGFDQFHYYERHMCRTHDATYIGQLGHARSTEMLLPYLRVIVQYKSIICTERLVAARPDVLERLGLGATEKLRRVLVAVAARFNVGSHPDEVIGKTGWYRPRDDDEKALVLARSKIAVGLSRVRGFWEEQLRAMLPEYETDSSGLFYQPKSRTFEAPASGALLINDYYPELEEMFEIGKEVVTFQFGDIAEFSNLLQWYLRHDTERQRIAEAGYSRSIKQHTLAHRLQEIITIVEKAT